MAERLGSDTASVQEAAKRLREGQLVGLPTETVYGLAANCADLTAVARIFSVKARPSFDPLIVHILPEWLLELEARGIAATSQLPAQTHERIQKLTRAFWPGPLSLIFPRSQALSHLVTGGLETVAIRAPAHPTAVAVLRESNLALAAPSANRFGGVSPTRADDVLEELGAWMHSRDLVLDGGPCRVGVESTVLDPGVGGNPPRLLRPGGVTLEQIEDCLGEKAISAPIASGKLESPGQLASHYAPRTELVTFAFGDTTQMVSALAITQNLGALLYCPPEHHLRAHKLELSEVKKTALLTDDGDEVQAAARLFTALREIDSWGFKKIAVELPPNDVGLCRALTDRLKRAAAPR
jgi:L-threonylcarbamoyladenylate synthase